jgi:hypothetical protein
MKTPKPRFALRLEAVPGDSRPPACRLKLLLKVCLRAWGLRCVTIHEIKPEPAGE